MSTPFCSLDGRVAVVTGAARGIGQAIAELLANQGANIVIADIQYETALATAESIAATYNRKTYALPVNVADSESARNLIDQTIKQFDRLDILVNNAGITRDMLIMRMDESDWDIVINVNLKGFRTGRTDRSDELLRLQGRIDWFYQSVGP